MSRYEKYFSFDVSGDGNVFEFASVGPKGEIKMVVQFVPTEIKNVFNLGFGNLMDDGSIDDRVINDNKDRDKILATIASIVYDFVTRYPERAVFFTGSTEQRTRLYRMALTVNYSELEETFVIFGLLENRIAEPFQKRKSYNAFLVKLK